MTRRRKTPKRPAPPPVGPIEQTEAWAIYQAQLAEMTDEERAELAKKERVTEVSKARYRKWFDKEKRRS